MIDLHRTCPICDCRTGHLLHSTRYHAIEKNVISADVGVVSCEQCGFCFADTRATQADYDIYYRERSKYADATMATGSGISPYDQERLRQTARQIEAFAPRKDQRLLDIGCATGGLLSALRAAGFNQLTGIDPSAECVSQVQASGFEGHLGNLFDLPKNAGSYEGIILSHVLEHVCDLRLAIRAIKSLIAPDGWFYLEVPDASAYEHFLRSPFQDFNTEHINHFSAIGLRNLLVQEGLVVESSESKQLQTSQDILYPALSVFARVQRVPETIQPDCLLTESLQRYITASRGLLSSIDEAFSPLIETQAPVVVWGTGQLTMKLLTETRLNRANLVGFIDGNRLNQGRRLFDLPILAPENSFDPSAILVIASLINQDDILRNIRTLNLPNPLFLLNERAPR